jgi:hypothetical protein
MAELSKRSLKALKAIANTMRSKCELPERYKFQRNGAEHLCRLGLADYRGFDGESHGGFFITDAGRAKLIDVFNAETIAHTERATR